LPHSDHAHDHDHDHGAHAHGDPVSTQTAHRVSALVLRLEHAGVTSDAEITSVLERYLAAAGPGNGARLAARAWVDPQFKAHLLSDANAAIAALSLDMTHWAPVRLIVVENTPRVHNVVVCTLCSCYPLALLGPAPRWYKSEAYRSRVVREPRALLREFGAEIGDDVEIAVWDSTAELRYMVLPLRPPGTEGWSEERLAELVSRDALIGTAR
jgi:nitrile hydratase